MLQESGSSTGLVSIVLSGAELAALDLSHLQLFWSSASSSSSSSSSASSSQGGNETRIELRRKSGVAVESPVIVPASVFQLSRIEGCRGGGDDSFATSDSSVEEEQQQPPKLRLFGSESSAAVSPIVLKSRAVIDAEKGRQQHHQQAAPPPPAQQAAGWRRRNKKRAVSMDEASLGRLDHPKKQSSSSIDHLKKQSSNHSSKDDLSAILQRSREIASSSSSWRPSKKSEPMPLPLPPLEIPENEEQQQRQGEEERSKKQQQQHRRHLSIDLRASPAAKFVVKVMPWEVPRRSPSSPLAATAAAQGTPQSCFVPFKWEEAPGKPKLLLRNEEQRFFRHHNNVDHHQPPLRLPPRLQADLSHHKRGHKTSSSSTAIAISSDAAAATSPTSILDAAATESTPSSCAASVSSPNAADEAAARGKCVEPQGGFCVIPSCKELAPEEEQQHGNGNSSSIRGKLRAFFAWQVWQRLVLGKKKGKTESDRQEEYQQKEQQQQQCESYDNFDELLQRNNRRKKKKKRRNRIRVPADHNKNGGYNAQDYSLRSPSPMVFSWFASPLQVRQRDNIGQRAFTRIAASCDVLKKVVMFKRLRWCHHRRRMHLKPPSSRTNKSIYRPLLCRVDADSAAFACSSSSTI